MATKKVLFPLGLVGIPVILLTLLLWALPAGATHSGDTKGTLSVSPVAVSPSVAIATADRTITITLTDKNLNHPLYVGTGPASQAADPTVSGANGATLASGDRISTGSGGVAIATSLANPGEYLIALNANPIGDAASTPLADRDDDGDIDIADIVIVDNDCDANGSVDLTVGSIFDASRGLIYIKNTASCPGTFTGFGIRYATPGIELTRSAQTITESLTIPTSNLHTGETFTHTLSLTLQDSDASGTINSGDVAINTGSGSLTKSDFVIPAGVATVTLAAAAAMDSGDTVGLLYTGDQVITLTGVVASGDTFEAALTNALQDGALATAAIGVDIHDIVIVTGSASVSAFTGGTTNTATFAATAALVTGDTIKIRYAGIESLTVPATGLYYNATLGTGESFNLSLDIDSLPLQDTNASGTVTTADVVITIAKRTAAQTPIVTGIGSAALYADAARGLAATRVVTLVHTGDALAAGTTVVVSYKGLKDLVYVEGAHGSMALRLRESGADTGIFTGDVIAVDLANLTTDLTLHNLAPMSGDRPQLSVNDGSSIRFSYTDKAPVKTITDGGRVLVESEAPSFSGLGPTSGDITNNLSSVLTGTITDTIAGVNTGKDTSIVFAVLVDGIPQTVSSGDVTVTETPAGSGVFVASYGVNKISSIASAITGGTTVDLLVTWSLTAIDKAGNSATTAVQVLTVNNEPPDVDTVVIGEGWNTTTSAATESRTSVRVNFTRAMDSTSFQASDFTVGGVAPTAVSGPFVGATSSVFLTVPTLAPDATPTVALVGQVLDLGGNGVSSATVTDPTNSIPPALTVTVSSDTDVATVSKAKVTLAITSDELIVGAFPTLVVHSCGTPNSAKVCTGGAVSPTIVRTIVTEQLSWSFVLSGLSSGDYNIGLTVQDAAGNSGTAGTFTGDPRATTAYHFEIDNALPTATTVPAAAASQAEADLFLVTIDWSNEAIEYSGDTQAAATLTKAILDTGDANERDILSLGSVNAGGNVWTLAIPDLELGAHDLTFAGKDAAGNLQAETTVAFTVTERAKYSITVQPGLNLISLPAPPKSSAIGDIITNAHDIPWYSRMTRITPWARGSSLAGIRRRMPSQVT